MGSGVIFLVIIGLWCAFLVPHAVRSRATLGGSRVRDRFSTAMRVLARRPPRPARRPASRSYLHRPAPRSAQAPAGHSAESAQVRRASSRGTAAPALLAVGGLALLAGAVPASVVAVLLGSLPAWFPVVPVATLAAVAGALRAVAVRRRARTAAPSRARPVPEAAPVAAATPVGPVAPAQAAVAAAAPAGPAEQRPVAQDDGLWTPVPVPPPTYTLKPTAPRRVVQPAAAAPQRIELPDEEPSAQTPVWDLDAVLERRRAAAG